MSLLLEDFNIFCAAAVADAFAEAGTFDCGMRESALRTCGRSTLP
jgi:hypothetical protein